MQPSDSILPHEIEVLGQWLETEDGFVSSIECDRISCLTSDYLVKICTDESGWETLFKDPNDKRLWLHTYPQSSSHAAGPPKLHVIDIDSAKVLFDRADISI